MATDLLTRKTSSKSDAYLQSKFAELCARIKRADLVAHFLLLSLAVLTYALCVGLFDWLVGNSTAPAVAATRWVAFAVFVGTLVVLVVQSIRCVFRRISPYYVAHQLEQSMPDAKNSLINWLDMNDEELPSAFQRNLSDRAAEQLQESDSEQAVTKHNNWILLGVLGVPALGLMILLFLGPAALAGSLLRAFLPFYTPTAVLRTQITLVQPEAGDAEVSPTQSITFLARIDGRVPAAPRPDAPKLLYRYQANEDYLWQPLQLDGSGTWTAQLPPGQLRTGFTYKLSAGDAETPEYQVRVRARAHVKQFEIAYHHRAYRGAKKIPPTLFPNERETRPVIRGPIGSDVEVVLRTSRPVKKAALEIVTSTEKKEVPLTKLADDAFRCKWTLAHPGKFRVMFTTIDAEDNNDRDWHSIDVPGDDAPKVTLTSPAKDAQLAENDTLLLEGEAFSNVGIKALTLHLRVSEGPEKDFRQQLAYRPELPLQLEDGTFERAVSYLEVVPLDQLKNTKGTIRLLQPGTVLEYWLEAVDCTDVPNLAGNVGRSDVYKVVILAKPKDDKVQQAKRMEALKKQKEHAKKQDADRAQQSQNRNQNQTGGGATDPKQDVDRINQEKKDAEEKIKQAMKDQADQQGLGHTKSAEPKPSATKDGPPESGDGPQPQPKDSPSMAPGDSGTSKDKGDKDGSAGNPKDDGDKKKSKDDASKGERKDGPKESPATPKADGPMDKGSAGGTKSGGMMGMDTPMPAPPKEPGDGAPMPIAKDAKGDSQTQGHAKGVEENGPDLPNKDADLAKSMGPPTGAASKSGMVNDAGGLSKEGSPDPAAQPGGARGAGPKTKQPEPSWDELAQLIEQLPGRDARADKAGNALKEIAEKSEDPRKRDLARDALKQNGRDPKTSKEEKKGPNPFGAGSKSVGIGDDVKAAAANREFAARIGQMQLDDWKKRLTPDLLKKAGLSEADWLRYLRSMQAHDAAVRRLNAKLLQDALKTELRGSAAASAGVREVESTGASRDPLTGRTPPPPELQDALRRFQP